MIGCNWCRPWDAYCNDMAQLSIYETSLDAQWVVWAYLLRPEAL